MNVLFAPEQRKLMPFNEDEDGGMQSSVV